MNDSVPKPQKRLSDHPPEVIKRWMRIKMIPIAEYLARWFLRFWLPIAERKRKKALEFAFTSITKVALKYEKDGFHTSLAVFNIALYLLLAERDLQAVKIDALCHRDPWKRNLAARMILLTLHEWDMDKVTGQRLKKAFQELNTPAEIQKEANEALRAIRKIQEKAKSKFGELRNSTIAHRDPNALAQYRAIQNLDIKDVFALGMEFYKSAEHFNQLLPKIMINAGSMESLLKQFLTKSTTLG